MIQRVGRRANAIQLPPVFRANLYLVRLVAVGLIAIGVSGLASWGIRWRFGDDAIAGDSTSAHLSDARCADLLKYHPHASDCTHAELAHHADEIVDYRLMAGVLGLLGVGGWVIAGNLSRLDVEEVRRQRRRYRLLATAAFGAAALALLAIGSVAMTRDPSNGASRWFADGGVSAAFFAMHAIV